MNQSTFASFPYATKKKRTRREAFLAEMEAVVPGARLTALIKPHYPKAGQEGRAAGDVAGGDAAGLFYPAVVRAVRPGGGGFKRIAIDPVDRL